MTKQIGFFRLSIVHTTVEKLGLGIKTAIDGKNDPKFDQNLVMAIAGLGPNIVTEVSIINGVVVVTPATDITDLEFHQALGPLVRAQFDSYTLFQDPTALKRNEAANPRELLRCYVNPNFWEQQEQIPPTDEA